MPATLQPIPTHRGSRDRPHPRVSPYYGQRCRVQPDIPIPIMYFAIRDRMQMTPDDIAAISVAYPNPARPLESETGTIRGQCVLPLEPDEPTSPAEQACQSAITRALGTASHGITRCLVRCETAARRDQSRACRPGGYDPETARCIARAARRSSAAMRRRCTGASGDCPLCIDRQRNCTPDAGFGRWVDQGIGRPLEAEQRKVEALHGRAYCGGPAATKAEVLCVRTVAMAA